MLEQNHVKGVGTNHENGYIYHVVPMWGPIY